MFEVQYTSTDYGGSFHWIVDKCSTFAEAESKFLAEFLVLFPDEYSIVSITRLGV